MAFFEKGTVRIHYEEAGSGFPLLLDRGRWVELEHPEYHRRLSAVPCHEGVRQRAPLRRIRPAQCAPRPIVRPARDRPAFEFPHRRSARADGSSRLRQVHGDRVLHRWSPDLESDQARTRSRRRRRARDAVGLAPEMRDLFYDNNMKGWAPQLIARRPTSRWRWPKNS